MKKGGYSGGMGGGGFNMQQMMKQAQKMQQDIANAQEELKTKEIEVSAGGGVVNIVITGDKQIKSIKLDPQVVDPDDIEMLQDLLIAGINEANAKADELASSIMGGATGGMDLGGLI